MEAFLGLLVGLGLSAACGFRVFVPLLALSIASLSGHVHLASPFAWIGTYPAAVAFATATAFEIAGYYIPVLDHFLDTITTPAAIVAGTIITASFAMDLSPLVKWSLAIIAGGGLAGTVQATTVAARAVSTGTTGGLGNPIVSTAELGASIFTSILAILVPVVAIVGLGIGMFFLFRWIIRRRRARPGAANAVIEV